MNSRLFSLTVLAVATLIAGCDQSEKRYKPSDAPLTLKLFEKYLQEEKVPYRVTENGFYVAERGQAEKMIQLGHRANNETLRTTGIKLTSPCTSKELRLYLQEHSLPYVEVAENGEHLIELTTNDYQANNLVAVYAGFVARCGESR